MKTIVFTLAVTLAVCFDAGCSSRRTERSAAIGAATGAVVGGIIGNQSGNPRTGAAIGAAVGGVAGGAYGSERDRETAASTRDNSDSYYMSLMTPEEVDILRARARSAGNHEYPLTDYLTEQEKENLRRRDAARREVGR